MSTNDDDKKAVAIAATTAESKPIAATTDAFEASDANNATAMLGKRDEAKSRPANQIVVRYHR